MAKETKPKKEKKFDNNRKNQAHIGKNFNKVLSVAYTQETPENFEAVKGYFVMAAKGLETNWKPKESYTPERPEPTEPSPADEAEVGTVTED